MVKYTTIPDNENNQRGSIKGHAMVWNVIQQQSPRKKDPPQWWQKGSGALQGRRQGIHFLLIHIYYYDEERNVVSDTPASPSQSLFSPPPLFISLGAIWLSVTGWMDGWIRKTTRTIHIIDYSSPLSPTNFKYNTASDPHWMIDLGSPLAGGHA